LGQYGKDQSNTDIFRIGPIPVSPITTRLESARHFRQLQGKITKDIGLKLSLIYKMYTTVLLGDVFHIGLAIGPRPAVLA
jgi:hypothetical protein